MQQDRHHTDMVAARRIVVLTGAGISAESGIRTFRASDGLWEDHKVEDVATPEGFAANPVAVHQFYNDRRRLLLNASIRPNPAHTALARLEHSVIDLPGHDFLLITQNIDNLHERAGSRALVHMHGELLKMRCEQSGLSFDIREDLMLDTCCRCCREPGNLRPDVVWFGEIPLSMAKITKALTQCDLFIAIGTSGNVYPAAGFFELAREHGAHTVELNLESTNADFDEHICGPASTVVPDYVERLLSSAN
ncbi:Sir2 family NAD+-dependent deacetylase [Pseudohongiella sp.]|uniref:Deacetylase sirtuin-type domain-containing protein n=1 Tax=marine sediment metagenome TaxID=412755 RepID=A0A0F9W7B2_9ZZZZ|nr:Sir2 family NAD+-dependent deacetylase [Pseudohongiella sp.]HDZ09396.1 NAD-dependent protein deacylase [Pseudohongiella sp.]HEA63755.1 NAD-dependent protein deacylase [Pseudohongiella sp.]